MQCGGLDIGGTKIEARLFDAGLASVTSHRVPTPRGSVAEFMAAVGAQIAWLRAQAGADLPIGVSLAGIIEPRTGIARTANLPIGGANIVALISDACGDELPVINDSMALIYSEIHDGAADGAEVSVGLILGTGVAAGVCIGRSLAPRHGGVAVEIGHAGMSARALARYDLPLWGCGCGREGCVESYVSGPGLTRLAQFCGLGPRTAPSLVEAAATGDAGAAAVLEMWTDLAVGALDMLQLTLAPQVVVLGGGLSQMPDVAARLSQGLARRLLPGVAAPQIRVARHGDSSGVRGVALLARQIRLGEVEWAQ